MKKLIFAALTSTLFMSQGFASVSLTCKCIDQESYLESTPRGSVTATGPSVRVAYDKAQEICKYRVYNNRLGPFTLARAAVEAKLVCPGSTPKNNYNTGLKKRLQTVLEVIEQDPSFAKEKLERIISTM